MRLKYFSLILLALLLFFISSASAMSLDDSYYGEFDSLVVDSGDTVVDDSMDVDLDDSDFEYSYSDDSNICVDDLDEDAKYTDKSIISDDLYYSKDYKLSSDFDSSLFSSSVSSLGASKTSTVITASNLNMYYDTGKSVVAYLKTSSGKAISGQSVKISIDGRSWTKTTDSKGKVSLPILTLTPKVYPCTIKFAGTSSYAASSKSINVTVKRYTSVIEANNLNMVYGTNKSVVAYLKNGTTPLKDKSVKISIDGRSWTKTTDSKGKVSLPILTLTPKVYPCTIKFAGNNYYSSCSKMINVTVKGYPTYFRFSSSSMSMNYNDSKKLTVRLLNSTNNKSMSNKVISFVVNGKIYNKTTNSTGHAVFNIPVLNPGVYTGTVKFGGSGNYASCSKMLNITVKNLNNNSISFSNDNVTFIENTNYNSSALKIFLKDSKGKGISNQVVSVSVFDGDSYFVIKDNFISSNHSSVKVYNLTTDSEGCVCLGFNLPSGSYNVSVSFGNKLYNDCSNSLVIPVYYSVVHNYTLDDVISAAIVVKNYVNANNRLPDSVVVGDENCSIGEFSYLMSNAISNIYYSDFGNLSLSMNYSYFNHGVAKCNDDLSCYSYSNVARNIVLFMDLYSYVPDAIGSVDFDCYSYTFAKILTFYNITGHLPLEINFNSNLSYNGSSLCISRGNSSQFRDGCNEVNQLSDLSKYLVNGSGSFCEITSSIRNTAKALTSGMGSDWDKANAIFKFVRDDIGYSFYYNSIKGASKALDDKMANDCDKSNLLVALFRSVGLPARYCHAINTLNSGLNVSHVWVQVLVDGIWYTADATNTYNQLGNILNWLISSICGFTQYDLLPF